MQSSITSSVSITPEEVKLFFQEMKKSSDIPVMPTTLEISQIIKIPEITLDEKSRIRKKLISFRDRIKNGEKARRSSPDKRRNNQRGTPSGRKTIWSAHNRRTEKFLSSKMPAN